MLSDNDGWQGSDGIPGGGEVSSPQLRGSGGVSRPQRLLSAYELRLTRSLGDELAHLLLHSGGVALGADNLAGFVILEAHDAHKLFAAFDADIFIGGHISPPDQGDESLQYIIIIISSSDSCKGGQRVKEKISPARQLIPGCSQKSHRS